MENYVVSEGYCCSVTKSCPTLRIPKDCSIPGFPALHYFLEYVPTYIHCDSETSNHLILCCSLLLLPSVFPSIRVFTNESALGIRWPKYRSFSFNISPSNEYPGLISFRMDWFDLPAVQDHNSKHLFFGAQPSLWFNSHIHIQPLERP